MTWRRRQNRVVFVLILAAFLRVSLSAETARVEPRAVVERTPVLLVPGWSDEAPEMEPMIDRLRAAGWSADRVLAITFEDKVGSNIDHADEIEVAIAQLLSRTGSEHVDVVAHSMGGLATRWYLATRDDPRVRRTVFLATPHRGTLMGYAAWGEGGKEMRPGSAFLLELAERSGLRGVPDGVEALTIRSMTDMHIVPNESSTLTGIPDVELCCPTHVGLLDDVEAWDALRAFLVRE